MGTPVTQKNNALRCIVFAAFNLWTRRCMHYSGQTRLSVYKLKADAFAGLLLRNFIKLP